MNNLKNERLLQNFEERKIENYPDVLSAQQVKEILGVGKNLIYKLLSDKKIKAKKLGHNWIVSKSNLIKFIESEDEA